jgi:3-hydroxyisobutyrate dehydrogenase
MRVAVLGAGIMGSAIARDLLRAGHSVSVWNRSRDRAEPLAADGAELADAAGSAVVGVDVALTMLTDAEATEDVAAEFLPALPGEAVWLQMGTIGIDGLARMLELAREHRVPLVDAPVSGTKEPAEKGELTVLASGDADAVSRCEPIFEAIGQKTVRLGEAGEGTRLKLVLNNWLVGLVEGLAETLVLARALGLDPKLFLETIAEGALDMPYAQLKGKAMLAAEFPPSFPLRLARKDAELVVEAAKKAGIELPLAEAVRAQFVRAEDDGHGDEDLAAVYLSLKPG